VKKAVFWAEGKFLLVGGVGSCRKKKKHWKKCDILLMEESLQTTSDV